MSVKEQVKSIKEKHSPIAVIFGSSTGDEGSELYSLAFEVGRELAKQGFTIANGGYTGTMDATARGALEAGGVALGITTDEIVKVVPSSYLTEEVRFPNLMTRLEALVLLGDIYVLLPGSSGTLTELALVWDKQKLGLIPIRPMVLFGKTWHAIYEAMFDNPDPLVPLSSWKLDSEVKKHTFLLTTPEQLAGWLTNELVQFTTKHP